MNVGLGPDSGFLFGFGARDSGVEIHDPLGSAQKSRTSGERRHEATLSIFLARQTSASQASDRVAREPPLTMDPSKQI